MVRQALFSRWVQTGKWWMLILVLAVRSASGQTLQTPLDGWTPPGLAPGSPAGSYALSGLENISYYSGHLNFRLPLMEISGRGSARYTMFLPIEQQKWHVEHVYSPSSGTSGEFHSYYAQKDWWSSQSPGYGPGVLMARFGGHLTYQCDPIQNPGWLYFQYTLTRLTFTDADGTEYELRDQLTGGQPSVSTICSPRPSRGRVFVTADGTAATFTANSDIYDFDVPGAGVQPNSSLYGPSGELAFRDGRHYRIDGGKVTWMRDRNGNQLSFTYEPPSAGNRVTQIKDSLNRVVQISYATASRPYDEIIYKGLAVLSDTSRFCTVCWLVHCSNRLTRP